MHLAQQYWFRAVFSATEDWAVISTWSSEPHEIQPFAGEDDTFHFLVFLIPWVFACPQESNLWPSALKASPLSTELRLLWSNPLTDTPVNKDTSLVTLSMAPSV